MEENWTLNGTATCLASVWIHTDEKLRQQAMEIAEDECNSEEVLQEWFEDTLTGLAGGDDASPIVIDFLRVCLDMVDWWSIIAGLRRQCGRE